MHDTFTFTFHFSLTIVHNNAMKNYRRVNNMFAFMCFSVLALMSFTVSFDRAYPTMNVFFGKSWSR